jgi:hypothetical protein
MLNAQEKQVHVAICDRMTVEDTQRTIQLIKQQYESCGQPLFYVALVPEDAPVPDQAVRNAMALSLREIQEHCDFTAVIFTGDGIKAGIKRTFFSGVLMVMMKGKWHVARSVDDLIKKFDGDARRLALLQTVARLATERGFCV